MKSKEQILSDVLLDLYAPCNGAELPTRLLQAVEKLVPANTYVINILNLGAGQWSNHGLGDFEALWAKVEPAWDTFHPQHPTLRELARGGPETVLKISDFVSPGQFRETGLYREVLRPFGGVDQIGLGLPVPGFLGGVAINRDRPFTEEERRLVALLRPHFIQAWRNVQTREALSAQLHPGEVGHTVLVDEVGRVSHLRKPAHHLLARYFPENPPTAKTLPKLLRSWVREAAGAADCFSARRIAPREVETPEGRLWCRLLPHFSEGKHLLVLEEDAASRPAAETLQRRFAISPTEAEVLVGILAGKRNKELAADGFRSPRTVEKHVQSLFEKLGVTSRTELATKALSAV